MLLVVVLPLQACLEPDEEEEPSDYTRAPEAPDPCTLAPISLACVAVDDLGAGGAGGAGGTSIDCIAPQAARLSCPSYLSRVAIARGSEGELDVLVAQKGRDGREKDGATYADTRAHVGLLRLSNTGVESENLDPIEAGPALSLGLVPGNDEHDTFYAVHRSSEHPEPGRTFTQVFVTAPQVLDLPAGASVGLLPYGRSAASGASIYLEYTQNTAFVALDLPDSPRMVELSTEDSSTLLDVASDGAARALVLKDSNVTVHGGADLDQLEWTGSAPGGVVSAADFLYGTAAHPDRGFVLYRRPPGEGYQVGLIESGLDATPSMPLDVTTKGCAGFEINFDCAHCPVGTECHDTEDFIAGARFFSVEERVFLAYLSSRQVKTGVADIDQSPFGICVCDVTHVATDVDADHLVIVEVVYNGPGLAPSLVERTRFQVGPGNTLYDSGFFRDARGGLDVYYGNSRLGFDANVNEFPSTSLGVVIVHLGAL